MLHIHSLTHSLPQVTSENSIPICDDELWWVMQLKHNVYESISHYVDLVWMWQSHKVSIFCESVQNDQNYFFSLRFRYSFNEACGDVSPCFLGGGGSDSPGYLSALL